MSTTSTPSVTTSEVTQHLGNGAIAVGDADSLVGFYGTTPIAKPTLGGSDAAAIIAALVALGLVNAA